MVLLLKFYHGGLLYFFCQLNVVPSKISSMVFHSFSFSSSVCQVIDTLSTPTTRVTDQSHSVSLQGKGNVLGAGWRASHIALKLSLLAPSMSSLSTWKVSTPWSKGNTWARSAHPFAPRSSWISTTTRAILWQFFTRVRKFSKFHRLRQRNLKAYILKAQKFAEPLFQSKEIAEKCVNPASFLGHLG